MYSCRTVYFHYREIHAVDMNNSSKHHVVYESRDRLNGFAIMRSQSGSTYVDCCIMLVYSFDLDLNIILQQFFFQSCRAYFSRMCSPRQFTQLPHACALVIIMVLNRRGNGLCYLFRKTHSLWGKRTCSTFEAAPVRFERATCRSLVGCYNH